MRPYLAGMAVLLVVSGVASAQTTQPNVVPLAPAQVPPEPPLPVALNLIEQVTPTVPRLTLQGEYLMWWSKNGPLSASLLAGAPSTSTAFIPGAPGNPDTLPLLSTSTFNVQSGLRLTGTWNFGDERRFGLEGSYFLLGDATDEQSAFVDGSPTAPFIVNPFLAATPLGTSPVANYLGTPGFDAGGGSLMMSTRFQGAELNLLGNIRQSGSSSLTLLTGFRYFNLLERLSLTTSQNDLNGSFFPGQYVKTIDEFRANNNFYGGQVGARFTTGRGIFFLSATGKVALGVSNQQVSIDGVTTTNTGPGFASPIPVTTVPGGIYAQPTNIGHYTRDRFAVAPEVTVQVGVNLTKHLSTFVGYNFLYISSVARPGQQIDATINPTYFTSFTGVPTGPLVGPARPAQVYNSTDFWAQGVNFGMRYDW
ncbi:MAG: hypothetical protein C0467_28575 [Planctomycetaceae bacterium]|nr:hypothetical protein [Planctomycetaceae bacterium]